MRYISLFFLFCLGTIFPVKSQTTFLVDTAFTTDIGYNGAPASCIFGPGGNVYGWNMLADNFHWVADDFTIPANETWTFDTVLLYGYQIINNTNSIVTDCYLQIYDGSPGAGGMLIWGDTVTNRLVQSSFTGIYRVASSNVNSTDRPIVSLKLHLSPAPALTAGTYWFVWSVRTPLSNVVSAFPKVLPFRENPADQNARMRFYGYWENVIDNGEKVGFNMIIKGSGQVTGTSLSSSAANVSIFPNPADDDLYADFSLTIPGQVSFSITDMAGRTIENIVDDNYAYGDHTIKIRTEHLAAGSYCYRLTTPSGTKTGLLTVRH